MLENWATAWLEFAQTNTVTFIALNSFLLYGAYRSLGQAGSAQEAEARSDRETEPQHLVLAVQRDNWLSTLEEAVMASTALRAQGSFVCCLLPGGEAEEEGELECYTRGRYSARRELAFPAACSAQLRYEVAFNTLETERRELDTNTL
jgi:hypothetical protein